jgi:hypothetical protein
LLSEEATRILSAGTEKDEMMLLFGLGGNPAALSLTIFKWRLQVILDMMSACI